MRGESGKLNTEPFSRPFISSVELRRGVKACERVGVGAWVEAD